MAVRTAPSLDRVGRGAPLPASDRPGLRRPSPVAVVLVTLSGAALAAYVWVALSRMGSPGALEWMEGGVAGHVGRVLAGHSVYGPPSLSFTPYLYTPLFYYVGAAFSAVLGAGLWPLRLVSFLSSIALVAAIGRLVWWDTRSRWAAAGAAGLFLACFRLGGAWLDLARVDTLCLALLMWSLVLARGATGARRAALAGFLAVLAVMTKQVALVPALAVIPHLAIGGRRRAAAYSLTLGAGLAAATVLLQVTSRGWFLYYALRLPLHHRIVTAAVGRFWTVDLVSHLWPALVVVGAGAVVALRHRRGRAVGDRTAVLTFHLPVGAALVAGAYVSRLHSGGYDNVLLPAYAAASIAFGLSAHRLEAATTGVRPDLRWAGSLALGAALVALLAYDPAAQVPGGGAGRATAAVVDQLRALPGPVYLPGHPWLLRRAGKPQVAQTAAVEDVLRAGLGGEGQALERSLARAVAAGYYGALVVDSQSDLTVLPSDTCRWYAPAGRLRGWTALLPVTGTRTAPRTVWLRRPVPLAPGACRGSGSHGGASAG